MPIPIPHGSKNPNRKGWQKERWSRDDLLRCFNNGQGVGLLLGEPSGGLIDVDLDCAKALAIADAILPPTDMVSGRASAPQSHRWYNCAPLIATAQFKDPSMADSDARAMIVELRSTGGQTVAPPSVHPSGEIYQWYGDLAPAPIAGNDLLKSVSKLAACALVARHWQFGQRHNTSLALAGMLLRAGWSRARVENFIRLAANAANDEEIDDRVRAVETTEQRVKAGAKATGFPRLADLIGDKVVACLHKWLALPSGSLALADSSAQASIEESEISIQQWPNPPGPAAFYGLAGDITHAIEPHTEADPAALLIQTLTIFGNLIGRSAHFTAEASGHYLNLFVVLVGRTAKGRKGSSLQQTFRLMGGLDEQWTAHCMRSGLSSGEGLIWAVRDPIEKQEPVKEKGRVKEYQTVMVDEGVADKRLLVTESEFAQTLKVAAREGNTLSAVIRQAWDTGNLRTLTKNSPACATEAHISIIGHITRDELTRYLNTTEASNGFANRFLWACVRRSKVLPEGGKLDEVDFGETVRRLRAARDFASGIHEMKRDAAARTLWHQVYEKLSDGKPGLLGAVTSRAEAQVMRLACLYALLDCSAVIGRHHLEAALALWLYCEESARFIFGDALGDPVADEILRALREVADAGLTRTQIRDLFGRNRSAGEITRALQRLAEAGLAGYTMEESDGTNRKTERWRALRVVESTASLGYDLNDINDVESDAESSEGLNVVDVVNVVATETPQSGLATCPGCNVAGLRFSYCDRCGEFLH